MRPPKKHRRFVNQWYRGRRRSGIYSHRPGSFAGMYLGTKFTSFRLVDTITGDTSLGCTA